MPMIIKAAVEKTAYHFDRLYDYIVPPELCDLVKPGCRVIVPFGSGNSRRQAIVYQTEQAVFLDDGSRRGIKQVLSLLDRQPVLSEELLRLSEWIKDNCFCALFDAARVMLPTGLNVRIVCRYAAADGMTLEAVDENDRLSAEERLMAAYLVRAGRPVEKDKLLELMRLPERSDMPERLVAAGCAVRLDDAVQKTGDKTIKMLRIPAGADLANQKLTPKQREVIELLEQAGSASARELIGITSATQPVINGLVKRGLVEGFESEFLRRPKELPSMEETGGETKLTDEQQRAYSNIIGRYRSGEYSTTLLFGITGSGKTSVFMRAIDDVVADGRGVIVMVPEIALTPQTLGKFKNRYGDKTAVFHSGLTLGQRLDEWKRVKNGSALIAIGTRSAVFAPFENLGLIIIDEEQEHTYKSESTPRYHARNVARFRCAWHKAPLLLASATPSLESFYMAAELKKSHLEVLSSRFGEARLPTVDIVDISERPLSESLFSPQLREAITFNLQNGYQSILLHNRRGFNTFVACRSCGGVLTCEHCSVSMTFHLDTKTLRCHYCGMSKPYATRCPSCGSDKLRYAGQGTQRAEDELQRLFPEARILRMDADSTSTGGAHADKLCAFARGDYDIMIGTQMVAKGLDFEKVTLVGVINADQMLYSDDFRSYERAFSLLTQVVGRSGRGEFSGRAIIQTLTPENPVIAMAARQDYAEFYKNEIKVRKAMLYPPFSDICVVGFVGVYNDATRDMARAFVKLLKQRAQESYNDLPLRVLGPSPAAINRIGGKYRYRLIIKCRMSARLRELMGGLLTDISADKAFRTSQAFIDMNPETVM